MKKLLAAACAALSLSLFSACATQPGATASGTAQKVLQVGIAQIVAHPSLDALRDGFKEGMARHGYVAGQNVVYDDKNASGDQATLTNIATTFRSKDLIVAIATPTAQAIAQAVPDKPIFFAGVTDPVRAGLVDSLAAPGGNITGTSDFPPLRKQLQLIRDTLPGAKTIGLLYSSSETNSEIQAALVKQEAPSLGFEVKVATVVNANEVAQAAESLGDVDAFFIGTDNTIVSSVEQVVQVAEQKDIPFFASDPDSVKRGAAAAVAVDYRRQGIETGEMAARMLASGGRAGEIPVLVTTDSQLSINTDAAGRMGLTLPEAVIARADIRV